MAEGGPDHALEGSIIRRGDADLVAAEVAGHEVHRHAPEVAPGTSDAPRRGPVPELAHDVAEGVHGRLGKHDEEARSGRNESGTEALPDRGTKRARHRRRLAWVGHAGLGARSFASMAAARRARASPSAGSAGHMGLKEYHCSGAGPIAAANASAMSWVAPWTPPGPG